MDVHSFIRWPRYQYFARFLSDCFSFSIFRGTSYTSDTTFYDFSLTFVFLFFLFLFFLQRKQSFNVYVLKFIKLFLGHLDLGHNRSFFYLPVIKETIHVLLEYFYSFSFTFKDTNHFEFILLHGMKNISDFIFVLMTNQLSASY